jgi:hypothetical protein
MGAGPPGVIQNSAVLPAQILVENDRGNFVIVQWTPAQILVENDRGNFVIVQWTPAKILVENDRGNFVIVQWTPAKILVENDRGNWIGISVVILRCVCADHISSAAEEEIAKQFPTELWRVLKFSMYTSILHIVVIIPDFRGGTLFQTRIIIIQMSLLI